MAKNLDELKDLNRRLTSLLDDPQLGLFTWHQCLAEVLNKIAEFSPDMARPKSVIVKAECHSDDHVIKADFDAAPWFAQATDVQRVDLIWCGFRGDYPADAVAEWMADHNRDVVKMFSHIEAVNKGYGETVGFECVVNPEDAVAWIGEYRPNLMHHVHAAREEMKF
jgi:hypothetical protein